MPEHSVPFQRVLVPVDFSSDSLAALDVASQRFAHPSASLLLVHAADGPVEAVTDTEFVGKHAQLVQARADKLHRQLQALVDRHKHQSPWRDVEAVVESGKPADVILSAANGFKASLVVMGAHGKTGLSRAFFGGTTYQVARRLGCSVMVLRSGK